MTDVELANSDDPDTIETEETPSPEPETPKRSRGARGSAPPAKQSKFTMPVKDLRAALKGICDVVEARNTIPILSNLLFEVDGRSLRLTGTDLDTWVVRNVPIETESPVIIRTTVGADVIKSIAAKLPEEATAEIAVDDAAMTVSAGRAKFKLATLPATEFPDPTERDADAEFEISALELQALFDGVRFAISTDETRYYLGGVYLHATTARGPTGDGEGTVMVLRGVATDGHRLACHDVPQPDGAGGLVGSIIPRKVVATLDKLLDGFEGSVDVRLGNMAVVFDLGETVVHGKLIDGQFPDYTRVVPTANDKAATIEVAPLVSAIGRVMLLAAGKGHAIRLTFTRDLVTLQARTDGQGEATEEVPCDYDGPEFVLGFNGKYLTEVCGHVQGDTLSLSMRETDTPTLITDTNPDARGLFVLMPHRV